MLLFILLVWVLASVPLSILMGRIIRASAPAERVGATPLDTPVHHMATSAR